LQHHPHHYFEPLVALYHAKQSVAEATLKATLKVEDRPEQQIEDEVYREPEKARTLY
jgi:hypothetical protein